MKRPIYQNCSQRPVDLHTKGFRKVCWKCRRNPNKDSLCRKKNRQKLRETVIAHYGGKCSCCGEKELAFLALDHIKNDGAIFRRTHGRGDILYKWIKRNNFPSGLRVLCHNCNLGRHINGGICPHQTLCSIPK